jgi:hypothetical protein
LEFSVIIYEKSSEENVLAYLFFTVCSAISYTVYTAKTDGVGLGSGAK